MKFGILLCPTIIDILIYTVSYHIYSLHTILYHQRMIRVCKYVFLCWSNVHVLVTVRFRLLKTYIASKHQSENAEK